MYNDFKIVYSIKVQNKLIDFVDFMSQNCRYRDSGLYDEILIVDNFVKDIKLFIRELKTITENKIKSGIIGQIESENKFYIQTKLVIFIRSYNIVYKVLVDNKEKTITLQEIFIKT